MGKSTKTYEERIQEKDLRIEKLAQELKRYEAQKKQLEKRKKEEERIRENHPDATKKDHLKEIQQSSGFLAIKVNDNHLKTIKKSSCY